MATQKYLGAPNAIVLCINERIVTEGHEMLSGVFYESYDAEGTPFRSMDEMTEAMEAFFDRIGFPHPSMNSRSFVKVQAPKTPRQILKEEKVVADNELLSKHGEIGTFIIRVQHRQNSSWQGRLTWVDQDQTLNFRSVWEMIKLIESAVDTVSEPEEEEEQQATWDI